MGWGRGLHDKVSQNHPVKKEGDGRSPVGIYRLCRAFGVAPLNERHKIKLPYYQIDQNSICVDDPESMYYNQIIQKDRIGNKDWQSAENMLEIGEPYCWGIVVELNNEPIRPGCGSCVFIHIWEGEGIPTAGCTAMKEEDIASLLEWLDPQKNPLLVQMPKSVYFQLEKDWNLPE